MKAKDMMDKNFITVKADDSINDVSKFLENHREFTCPVVDGNKLIGWITALDLTKGLKGYFNSDDTDKTKVYTIYWEWPFDSGENNQDDINY